MKYIREVFELIEGNTRILIGYQYITNHFIFDVNLDESFRLSDRLVGYIYKTNPLSLITYVPVVLIDSVKYVE